MPKGLTTSEFIEKAINVHKDRYNYSKVNYKTTHSEVLIICSIHGEFWQRPAVHLSGSGCPKCYGNRTTSKEKFVEKARHTHGDKYDYSKMVYSEGYAKVCIICLKHGEFWQTKNNHLKGKGCPICGKNRLSRRTPKEKFILDASTIHNNKYDYSLVNYETQIEKIEIICPTHGVFKQSVKNHLQGHGCPLCSWENLSKTRAYSWETIKEQCKNVHGDLYEYPDQIYTNNETYIKIFCKKHGEFLQKTTNHLQGQGCPICKNSKGERFIYNWFQVNNLKFEYQYKVIVDKIARSTNRIIVDFMFNYNGKQYFIEYNGIQHYKYIPYFHKGGITDFEKQQNRDKVLIDYCKNNNVELVKFNYNESYSFIEEELYKLL